MYSLIDFNNNMFYLQLKGASVFFNVFIKL